MVAVELGVGAFPPQPLPSSYGLAGYGPLPVLFARKQAAQEPLLTDIHIRPVHFPGAAQVEHAYDGIPLAGHHFLGAEIISEGFGYQRVLAGHDVGIGTSLVVGWHNHLVDDHRGQNQRLVPQAVPHKANDVGCHTFSLLLMDSYLALTGRLPVRTESKKHEKYAHDHEKKYCFHSSP